MKKDSLQKIAREYELSLILMFGSCAINKTHSQSDLDIAVLAKSELGFKKRFKLYSALSEIFTGKNIDLISLNHIDPLFLKKILENCKLLYGSKKKLSELKLYGFKRYCDYRGYLDLEKKFVHQFIEEFK